MPPFCTETMLAFSNVCTVATTGANLCRDDAKLSELRAQSRWRGVTTPLPFPAWLAAHSDAVVDAMLEEVDDEWRRLYVRQLAKLVRSGRAGIFPLAWYAFVGAGEEKRLLASRRDTCHGGPHG